MNVGCPSNGFTFYSPNLSRMLTTNTSDFSDCSSGSGETPYDKGVQASPSPSSSPSSGDLTDNSFTFSSNFVGENLQPLIEMTVLNSSRTSRSPKSLNSDQSSDYSPFLLGKRKKPEVTDDNPEDTNDERTDSPNNKQPKLNPEKTLYSTTRAQQPPISTHDQLLQTIAQNTDHERPFTTHLTSIKKEISSMQPASQEEYLARFNRIMESFLYLNNHSLILQELVDGYTKIAPYGLISLKGARNLFGYPEYWHKMITDSSSNNHVSKETKELAKLIFNISITPSPKLAHSDESDDSSPTNKSDEDVTSSSSQESIGSPSATHIPSYAPNLITAVTTSMANMYEHLSKIKSKPPELRTTLGYHHGLYKGAFNNLNKLGTFNNETWEHTQISARGPKLWAWVVEGLKLTFSPPSNHAGESTNNAYYATLYQDVMTPLVMFNAMFDDVADQIQSLELITVGLSILPTSNNDDIRKEFLNSLQSNNTVKFLTTISDTLNSNEQESAVVTYFNNAATIFYKSFQAFYNLLEDISKNQRENNNIIEQSQPDTIKVIEQILISYEKILDNFKTSCQLNKKPNTANFKQSEEQAYHNMNIHAFRQMTMAVAMVINNEENISQTLDASNLRNIGLAEQQLGRLGNILATALPTKADVSTSRELNVGDITGLPEIISRLLNERVSPLTTSGIVNLTNTIKDFNQGKIDRHAFIQAIANILNKVNAQNMVMEMFKKEYDHFLKETHSNECQPLQLFPQLKDGTSPLSLLLFHLMGRGDI